MILLTEKDADFVASIARRELTSTKQSMESTLDEIESKKSALEKIIPFLDSEELKEEYRKKLDKLYISSKEAIKNQWFASLDDFSRIINLMITGSDLQGENND
ncbi:MAG: hypothetical protein L6V86_08435 [Treponema sp.]|nr:MAG: hypothetical protein L6V86_08435 [Treponema sp.]